MFQKMFSQVCWKAAHSVGLSPPRQQVDEKVQQRLLNNNNKNVNKYNVKVARM